MQPHVPRVAFITGGPAAGMLDRVAVASVKVDSRGAPVNLGALLTPTVNQVIGALERVRKRSMNPNLPNWPLVWK